MSIDPHGRPPPTGLTVHIGPSTYSIGVADAPVTVGRPGITAGAKAVRIRVPDPRISVDHLVIDIRGGHWIGTDRSRNGTFVDGWRSTTFQITDGMTVLLGHPQEGIRVRFRLHEMGQTTSDATVRAALIAETVDASLATIAGRVARLPEVADPRFATLADGVLIDLRRLATMVVHAARAASGAAGLVSRLSTIRRAYDDLCRRAASAPDASLGVRLYAARQRSRLTVADVAELCDMVADEIRTVEAGGSVARRDAAALSRLLSILP